MKNNTWQKGCDMGFTVGQRVWGSFYGWGTITEIVDGIRYPITVKHDIGIGGTYSIDGCIYSDALYPSLFHKEQTFDYGKPEWQPKPGELCWVWDDGWDIPMIATYSQDDVFIHNLNGTGRRNYCAPFNNGQLPDEFKHLLKGGSDEG